MTIPSDLPDSSSHMTKTQMASDSADRSFTPRICAGEIALVVFWCCGSMVLTLDYGQAA